MQLEEALKQLDNWFKVPIDYKSVVPALAELKGTEHYDDYLQRVAEVEYCSTTTISNDVDEFIVNERAKLRRKQERFDQILDDMAGGKRIVNDKASYDDALLDEIANPDDQGSEEDVKRLDAFAKYMEQTGGSRRTKNDIHRKGAYPRSDEAVADDEYTYSVAVRAGRAHCPCCGNTMKTTRKYSFTVTGIILIIVCCCTFFPLALIPFFACRRDMVTFYCKKCRRQTLPRDAQTLPTLQ